MNSKILILFAFLALVQVNHAWNTKGGGNPVPQPFRPRGSGGSKSGQSQPRSSYQQQPAVSYPQDEASAEPTPQIPQTSFTCDGKPYNPGMYADVETNCRVYHVCYPDERKGSFFCGDGTVFNQKLLTCDYPQDTDCANSQRYWSANEDLGKPGAEPIPGQTANRQVPSSPSKTRKSSYSQGSRPSRPQYQTGFQPSSSYPQQPVKQKQRQPQKGWQPQKGYQPQQAFEPQRPSYNAYAAEDSGFVSEPIKKIKPTYKVVKTQQAYYPSSHPTGPHLSPAKAKVVQKAVSIDDLQQQEVSQGSQGSSNYRQAESYQQSDSYFSQQQTSGWQPSSGPVQQSPSGSSGSSGSSSGYYPQQQQQSQSPVSYRSSGSNQQQYSQRSDSQSGWRAGSQPGGGYSSNDISSQKIDLNIPQTNFKCEGLPYEPGMYADLETQCEVYHVCFDGRKESFICGKGTAFNQKLLVCDYPTAFECSSSPRFYSANENLVREGGSWTLRQPSNQQGGDGWSNQRKIKRKK